MIHPDLDLESVTAQLESLGFHAVTKLTFRKGFLDVRIQKALLPDNMPPDLIEPPFFRISIYEDDLLGVFHCPIDALHILDY